MMKSKTTNPRSKFIIGIFLLVSFLVLNLVSTYTASASWVSDPRPIPYGVIPKKPTGLTATPGGCGTGIINVSWNASVGATSYSLRDGATTIYTGASTSYSHTGLTASSSHSYTVLATNAHGSSAYTTAVVGTAPAVCAQPDLVAAAPTPSVATAGTALTFTSNISNIGSAPVVALTFNNLFQVATAAGGGGTVSTISVNTLGGLAAGANANVTSSSYTFPSSGTYSVRACADNNASFVGAITEGNEANNCSTWTNVTVSAAASADLTAGLTSPTTATAGLSTTFSSLISNTGSLTTGASFNNLFQVATSSNGGGTVSTISVNVLATLASGASNTVSSSSYTFSGAGTYSVRACADNNASFVGAITEGNEGNNCSAWRDVSVSVAIPSPQIIYFTASPSTLDLGESSTLSWHSTSTDSCTGTNFSTGSTSPVTGTAVVTPLAEGVSSYTLTCVNNTLGQFASDSTSVTVSIIVKKPVIKEN